MSKVKARVRQGDKTQTDVRNPIIWGRRREPTAARQGSPQWPWVRPLSREKKGDNPTRAWENLGGEERTDPQPGRPEWPGYRRLRLSSDLC